MVTKSELIKKATISLFAERGFDGTTIPLIAKEASVGTGTIYRYFTNKEELLNLIMQEEMARLEQILRLDFPEQESLREKFNHLFRKLIQYCQDYFDSLILISSHSSSLHADDKTKCEYSELLNFISNLAEKGRAEGTINQNLSNEIIVSIIFGSVVELSKYIHYSELDLSNELLKSIEESLWRAISN